ncbi:uncharacterized protein TNCV_4507211 [Trichonephila clavipes]|nr:uncharacterized protein TNCV_4507211 [Trichonephila clavipes]
MRRWVGAKGSTRNGRRYPKCPSARLLRMVREDTGAPSEGCSTLNVIPPNGQSIRRKERGCGSPVVKVSNHGRHVMSSIPVPLKTRRVGQRCTLNLSRAETSSRWCGVVVRRGEGSSGVVHVT